MKGGVRAERKANTWQSAQAKEHAALLFANPMQFNYGFPAHFVAFTPPQCGNFRNTSATPTRSGVNHHLVVISTWIAPSGTFSEFILNVQLAARIYFLLSIFVYIVYTSKMADHVAVVWLKWAKKILPSNTRNVWWHHFRGLRNSILSIFKNFSFA